MRNWVLYHRKIYLEYPTNKTSSDIHQKGLMHHQYYCIAPILDQITMRNCSHPYFVSSLELWKICYMIRKRNV